MLQLVVGRRASGECADLACPDPPAGADASLLAEALARGVKPCWTPARERGVLAWHDAGDARRLAVVLRSGAYDLVHVWHTRDHLLALAARALAGRTTSLKIVRSLRHAEAVPALPWNRWILGPGSDGVLCVSPGAAERHRALRGGRPLAGVFGAVDLERFHPEPPKSRIRAQLGLAPEHHVVGIVARVQPQRRFDLLLEAMQHLVRKDSRARLIVVGRGTHRESLAVEPARRLGLADRIVFAGYRRDDYVDVLRAMDIFTLLVPGSDGGCRALLEAAACGIPAVTTQRGALPEIVEEGATGRVVAEEAEQLAAAWAELLSDRPLRVGWGRAARIRAEQRFSIPGRVAAVEQLYRQLFGTSTQRAGAPTG
jgi:glycosyltransferase involved in cell wall biosynthesis